MLKKSLAVAALAIGMLGAANAFALPNLQIYIDGAAVGSISAVHPFSFTRRNRSG